MRNALLEEWRYLLPWTSFNYLSASWRFLWHRCIIIGTVSKNIILCFHTAILLDIELKFIRLTYVQFTSCFQKDMKEPQTLCFLTNLFKQSHVQFNNKYIKRIKFNNKSIKNTAASFGPLLLTLN